MSIKGRNFFSQSLKLLLKNDSCEYEILNADLFEMRHSEALKGWMLKTSSKSARGEDNHLFNVNKDVTRV